jgi:hypothetical protein
MVPTADGASQSLQMLALQIPWYSSIQLAAYNTINVMNITKAVIQFVITVWCAADTTTMKDVFTRRPCSGSPGAVVGCSSCH